MATGAMLTYYSSMSAISVSRCPEVRKGVFCVFYCVFDCLAARCGEIKFIYMK